MTDSLRDKIARVLHRIYGPCLGAHPDGWDREPRATQDMYREDADAVIRELGLRQEVEILPRRSWRPTNQKHRYVTEWSADD